jgi:beta-1,4-mannosyltransferase
MDASSGMPVLYPVLSKLLILIRPKNPPSIPVLAIAEIICFFRLTHLIIDWHNFGYSILALKLGDTHPLVRISKWYEMTLSRFAVYHFTVTNAMARILEKDFKIPLVLPLHDRPHSQFKPLQFSQRLAFLARLPETAVHLSDLERGKMRLLVSSTSWTPDEDFSVLLSSLTTYSDMATSTHPELPELLVIITGKGPQKEYYLQKVASLKEEGKLEMITIKTAWLSAEDYASLLGAADLGVSLHTSSSGVDLPMKVVDMFGAGLPVVAWRFKALKELVKDGVNGESFESTSELLATLVDLLGGDGKKLAHLKEGAIAEGDRRWNDEWNKTAGEVFGELFG